MGPSIPPSLASLNYLTIPWLSCMAIRAQLPRSAQWVPSASTSSHSALTAQSPFTPPLPSPVHRRSTGSLHFPSTTAFSSLLTKTRSYLAAKPLNRSRQYCFRFALAQPSTKHHPGRGERHPREGRLSVIYELEPGNVQPHLHHDEWAAGERQ